MTHWPRGRGAVSPPQADVVARRSVPLAAHDLGPGFRGVSFPDSGIVLQVPFAQLLFMLSVTISLGRYFVFSHFGFASSAYAYFYYFTDAALTLFLYLGICELGVRLMGTRISRKRAVLWSVSALLAMAWLSLSVASPGGSRMATAFVVDLSQSIFFVCCLAIALLWAWKLRNDSNDRIADRLVNVLSVYFLLFLLLYGARQLTPHASSLNTLYPMFSAWLPLGCGFALVSHEPPPRMKPWKGTDVSTADLASPLTCHRRLREERD